MSPVDGQAVQAGRVQHDLKARYLVVLEVHRLSPRMIRVTLGGDEMEGFASAGPTDHVKVFFPEHRGGRPVMPTVDEAGRLRPPTDGRRPIQRDYTVRRFDPEAGRIDIDFVLHGSGHGSSWAEQAKPGQVLGVIGPRSSKLVPSTFDRYLLGGDETALPAISRWLEHLAPGTSAIVIVEVADVLEEQALATLADADVTWLHRDGGGAGTTTALERAVRELALLDGDFFTWMAGETNAMRAVRGHLRDERGVPREWIDIDGYWKRAACVESKSH